MKNYETVLLDWDGNIAGTLDIWLDAYQEILIRHGHKISNAEMAANFTRFVDIAAGLGITDPEQAMSEANDIAIQLLPTIELYPNAIEVLDDILAKELALALITSSERKHIQGALAKFSLDKYFDAVVTGEEVTHRKPHPEPLLLALGRLGASKETAVVIGDSASDLGAANNAGIDSVLFYPPEHARFYDLEELKKHQPTFIVSDLLEIKDII